MTIHATVLIGGDHSANLNNNPAAATISVPFVISISDSLSASSPTFNTQGQVTIPLGLSAKKSDDAIRNSVVSFMLALDPAYIIDPDDIYFPMSR